MDSEDACYPDLVQIITKISTAITEIQLERQTRPTGIFDPNL